MAKHCHCAVTNNADKKKYCSTLELEIGSKGLSIILLGFIQYFLPSRLIASTEVDIIYSLTKAQQ